MRTITTLALLATTSLAIAHEGHGSAAGTVMHYAQGPHAWVLIGGITLLALLALRKSRRQQ